MNITIQQARAIIAGSLAHGSANGYRPLCVAVLDAGGNLVAFEREDGVANRRFDVAHGKAYGAISLGVNSRTLENMAIERPHFVIGATAAIGTLIAVPGGVIIRDGVHGIVGAVGVSGDTADNDEAAAIAGIAAAGLTPSDR
ncbi:MAG: heme-binding protein [Actinomycetota bacterium]